MLLPLITECLSTIKYQQFISPNQEKGITPRNKYGQKPRGLEGKIFDISNKTNQIRGTETTCSLRNLIDIYT